jgi:hypothetical protein
MEKNKRKNKKYKKENALGVMDLLLQRKHIYNVSHSLSKFFKKSDKHL